MTNFQLGLVLTPLIFGIGLVLYFRRASTAFDRKYGADPK